MEPEGFNRVRKKRSLVYIPRKINPVHAIISYFFFYFSRVFDECRTYDQQLVCYFETDTDDSCGINLNRIMLDQFCM
jgi:hypothetical protein